MDSQKPGPFVRAIRTALASPVWLYQKIVSPLVPARCIYHPSCSSYTRKAISRHGLAGVFLGICRILRCVGGLYTGGDDPVPEKFTFSYAFGSYKTFWAGRSDTQSGPADPPNSE